MARFTHLLPFSPLYDFKASKPVTINGVAYQPGEDIPADVRDDIGARRLQKLYEARQITPVAPAAQPKEGAFVVSGVIEQRPDDADPGEQVSGETLSGETLQPVADAPITGDVGTQEGEPNGIKIEHRGFGRWYATMPDGTEQGPMTKEQAESLLTV